MKIYRVNRHVDVSGASGRSIVAHAVEFTDGVTIVKFETGYSAYPTLADAIRIHGHNGDTVFELVGEYEGFGHSHKHEHGRGHRGSVLHELGLVHDKEVNP